MPYIAFLLVYGQWIDRMVVCRMIDPAVVVAADFVPMMMMMKMKISEYSSY